MELERFTPSIYLANLYSILCWYSIKMNLFVPTTVKNLSNKAFNKIQNSPMVHLNNSISPKKEEQKNRSKIRFLLTYAENLISELDVT